MEPGGDDETRPVNSHPRTAGPAYNSTEAPPHEGVYLVAALLEDLGADSEEARRVESPGLAPTSRPDGRGSSQCRA
ncbi:hypothetical protein ACH46L_31770, partial [Streptomyces althioticus]|uniref:hypothetical protein n=1 Tax=Streptomyces althioticus TaxID=83380 RepID=UPI0037A18E66